MSDIVITLPATVSWETYQLELNAVRDWKGHLSFKVPSLPKSCGPGDRCYLAWKGWVRGWMQVVGFSVTPFLCQTTGKNWSGKFIQRSGPFHVVKPLILYKGFQGYRYAPEEWRGVEVGATGK